MSVRFVLGRTGSGKTAWSLNEIMNELKQQPVGNPIIYLVPEQMTFQSEYKLVQNKELQGMVRAQVFSFTRLAWRVLQEVGGISRFHIDQTGLHMILRKIVEEHKKQFQVFGRSAEQFGFIEQMETMLTELKRYCITPETLNEKIGRIEHDDHISDHEKMLSKKLTDILVVYRQLESLLEGKYVDGEDYLTLLAEKIKDSNYLQQAHIYIDGFHSFTPQEYTVISELMRTCPSVTIALTIDKPYNEEAPYDLHLFRMPGVTYQKLRQLATEVGCEIEEPFMKEKGYRFTQSPSLQHLDRFFDVRPTVTYDGELQLSILQAVNRRAEIEGIGREIVSLVRDKGYRYRDIAIIVRNSADYVDLISTIFKDYEIPHFIDEKRTMLHHPLIELLRSTFETMTNNWRYESVFRCVKTDLLFDKQHSILEMREKTDRLENYVLSYGIQGTKWTNEKPWKYMRYANIDAEGPYVQTDEELQYEKEINELRQLIVNPILTLQKRLKRGKTVEAYCHAVYQFIDELQIAQKLENRMKLAEESGNLKQAKEHEQVWKAVIHLLDQMVELIGEQSISLSLFSKIMESGLEGMRFSLVPPAIDQVIVANFDLSRLTEIKHTFVIGVNEGVIPAKVKEEGFMTEEERELLNSYGVELAPGSLEKLLDDHFLAYIAFLSASEHLYISYPLADEEGKSLLASSYIKRIKEMFPTIKERVLFNEPTDLPLEEQLSFVHTPRTTISHLAVQLQAWKKHYGIKDIWWDVYNYLVEHDQYKTKTERVLNSLFYRNEASKLKENISRELYGEHVQASVSRMEMFNACPFSHFASHGLKLRERKLYRLEAPDIGELFHSALKHISEHLRKEGRDWKSLNNTECEILAEKAVQYLAPKLQSEILLSSNRYHYIKRKLQAIISRASFVLSEHAKASKFTPIGLELGFGQKAELPPITFTLPNGCTMELVGRIDRVDKAESSNGVLLRIVDYKSSDKTLDLTEVYYGLALQMLTYLDIVITHSKSWIGYEASPAGVLYFHVHNPMIKTKGMQDIEAIEEEIFKSFKMKGLLLGDQETIQLMDEGLEEGHGHSKIISAGLTKKGGFHSYSSIASDEQFDQLRGHVRAVFEEVGLSITNGETSINPYKLKNKTPCTYCSFKSVCHWDTSLEENEYRPLEPLAKEDLFTQLKKPKGGDE
ncbi:helicase-exonuclease AddAB subunit AddB [Sutcliffiella cohnii]